MVLYILPGVTIYRTPINNFHLSGTDLVVVIFIYTSAQYPYSIEASILSALHHPSIITHIESFEEDGFLCLVTEYAEKGDLSNKLEERKGTLLPEDQVLDYLVQISFAMLYLHKKKILHRDLKLQNVFLSADNMIKLGDFGIARVLKNTMECAKTVVGTPYYLSPEICENKPYNHKSDVWSAGCILYELCVQKHAFEANSITALVRKILRGQYEDIPANYSSNTRTLINAMLQQKPSARPAFLTILQQPFLQPYIHSFTRRCAAKGVTIPYADQLIQLVASNTTNNNVPSAVSSASSSVVSSSSTSHASVPLPPTTRNILQQNSHYVSHSGNNSTPKTDTTSSTTATTTSTGSSNSSNPKNVPSPYNSGKGNQGSVNVPLTVPDEGSAVRPVILSKARDGIMNNNNNNVRPPIVAARAVGGIVPRNGSGIPLAPNLYGNINPPLTTEKPFSTAAVSRISRDEDRVPNDYQPSKYKSNQHPSPSIIPRMVPIMETETNNIQVRQSIHPSNPSQSVRPVSTSLFPVSGTNTNTPGTNNNKPRPFIHDGKAYPLPVSVVKNGPSAVTQLSTGNTTATTGDPKWSKPIVISTPEDKQSVPNNPRKSERYEGKEDSTPRPSTTTTTIISSSINNNESTNDYQRNNPPRYRSSILADPLFQAPVIKQDGSTKTKTTGTNISNPPDSSKDSKLSRGTRTEPNENNSYRPLSRDTQSLSRNEPEDNDTNIRNNMDPSSSNPGPSRKGRISSRSTPSSRDSDASLSNEDLLAEADELLPYGLPLDAYKMKQSSNLMMDKDTKGLQPSKQIKGMRIAGVPNDTNEDDANETSDSKLTENNVPTPALNFTLVPAHLTRRKVAGRATILPGGIHRPEKNSNNSSSSSSSSGTDDNLQSPTPPLNSKGKDPDKLLLNGNTLKLPGVTNSKDSLTYRIECLRVFLSSIMGDDAFTKLYRSLTEGRGMNISVDLSKTVRNALGKERKGLLPLVFQLIYFEEQAYQGR